ncbi:MAG TPA: DUF5947 family protein, partial [Pirellulales bacterium]|nr:DUF5947 family protein [Pirellulales bacterium]
LWAPAERQLQCACDACAFLFPGQAGGRFRRVPRDASVLHDFRFDDATWNEFRLPIELAFFVERENPQRVVAAYPSPGGAVEADVEAECWRRLIELNPVLATVEREVEALLVHRIGASRRYYRVPIDVCFQLVGLIRKSWRGLGGGPQVWGAIDEFFNGLDQRASRRVGGRHA